MRDDDGDLLARQLGVRNFQQRDLAHVAPARRQDLPVLQMLKQRIETGVLRDDVKVRTRVLERKLPDIERDMKIERVRSAPRDLDVRRALAHALQGGGGLERDLRLRRADEDDQPKMILVQDRQRLRLDALVVDQDVVDAEAHRASIKRSRQRLRQEVRQRLALRQFLGEPARLAPARTADPGFTTRTAISGSRRGSGNAAARRRGAAAQAELLRGDAVFGNLPLQILHDRADLIRAQLRCRGLQLRELFLVRPDLRLDVGERRSCHC